MCCDTSENTGPAATWISKILPVRLFDTPRSPLLYVHAAPNVGSDDPVAATAGGAVYVVTAPASVIRYISLPETP